MRISDSNFVSIGGNATSQGIVRFLEDSDNGSNYIAIQSPAANVAGADYTLTLPEVTGDIIPGKMATTNFTTSLIVGHATTGTLSSAGDNVAVGVTAMDAITTADQTTAIGGNTLTALTTGQGNTAVGFYSMLTTVDGTYNAAIGRSALQSVTSGDRNVGVGNGAADNLQTGSGNVIIGDIDTDATDSDRTLKIAGYDGTTRTTWISGDSSGNVVFAGTATAAGGQLTTI